MTDLTIHRKALLHASPEEAWRFFSDPRNLRIITPEALSFRILTPELPCKITEGLVIDYSVRPLWGMKVRWTSKITRVEEGRLFVDEQIRGPYAMWVHEHRFSGREGGTLMEDVVRYRLPMGWLGRAALLPAVRNKLNHIFDYRGLAITSAFPGSKQLLA